MMHKGKRVYEEQITTKSSTGQQRKNKSPKKTHILSEPQAEYEFQLSHAKKLKINNITRNEFTNDNSN